jgi:amidase
MNRLAREQFINTLDPRTEPRLRVNSGDEVVAETWDAFMGTWSAGEEREILGPVAGPVAVRGALPGDALRVDLLTIVPRDLTPGRTAVHNTSASHGFLKKEFDKHNPIVLAVRDGKVMFPGGIEIPANPSVGFIATTYTEPRKTTSDSGPYGGDIDVKELTAGSTIWLPVFVPEALLCLGDLHAVCGDGCVGGTAAECGGEVRFRVTVEKKSNLARPRILTPDHLMTICYGEDVGEAMKQAVRDMVDHLSAGMDAYEAYALLSLAGDVRISRTFRPISPVKMMLARPVYEQIKARHARTSHD